MADVVMTPEDQTRLEHELEWFSRAEEEHKLYEARWDHQDELYFGHKRLVDAHTSSSPRDRDSVIGDARKEFGAELHIPYVFSTIHTIAPRTLSNRPKMLWLPRDKTAEQNVENVKIICDSQQQKANYELKLQTTNQGGLKHGLGVQKTYWRREERESFVLAQGPDSQWVKRPVKKRAWDDPYCDDVDIRDFYWDPFGDSMETVRKVLHRSWRDCSYIYDKIASGQWARYPTLGPDQLDDSTGADKHQTAWAGRRRAQGLSGTATMRDA
jgi:hypothetical protein